MEKLVSSILDNSTEILENVSGPGISNSTDALLIASKFPDSQTISEVTPEIVGTVGLIVCIIGACANALVLAVLVRARQHFGSCVHSLIANQSAMDLFACVFGIAGFVVMLTHGFKYDGDKILDGAICVIFESGELTALGAAFTGLGSSAENLGLIVITLERYFKVVHAIAHRKYYRNWMTKVGVAFPWIGGASLFLFPTMGTTRIVNGRCLILGVWPNKTIALVFSVVRLLFVYIIPVIVFVYCYGRIFHTIRRQSKAVCSHVGRRSVDVNMATTSRAQNTGQVQQQETGAATGAKLSRRELNVIKTTIAIIACYLIFWSYVTIAISLLIVGVSVADRNGLYLAGSLAFISLCVNPFIYASRYEVFRRYLKRMLNNNATSTPSNNTR